MIEWKWNHNCAGELFSNVGHGSPGMGMVHMYSSLSEKLEQLLLPLAPPDLCFVLLC